MKYILIILLSLFLASGEISLPNEPLQEDLPSLDVKADTLYRTNIYKLYGEGQYRLLITHKGDTIFVLVDVECLKII